MFWSTDELYFDTPRKVNATITELNKVIERIGVRNRQQQEELATAVRELRRLTAMHNQYEYRFDHQQQRAELDEVTYLLNDDIDVL